MKEALNLIKLPPIYMGKWATASDAEVQHEFRYLYVPQFICSIGWRFDKHKSYFCLVKAVKDVEARNLHIGRGTAEDALCNQNAVAAPKRGGRRYKLLRNSDPWDADSLAIQEETVKKGTTRDGQIRMQMLLPNK